MIVPIIKQLPMSDLMPVKEMYSTVYRLKTTGIDGYDYERSYAAPARQMRERQYASQKKGEKSNRKITARGSYLEDAIKVTKGHPSPGQYPLKDEWPKESKSMRNPSKKKTYLDEVIEHAKREKFPAPGHYNLAKSQKEIDAELKRLASKKV